MTHIAPLLTQLRQRWQTWTMAMSLNWTEYHSRFVPVILLSFFIHLPRWWIEGGKIYFFIVKDFVKLLVKGLIFLHLKIYLLDVSTFRYTHILFIETEKYSTHRAWRCTFVSRKILAHFHTNISLSFMVIWNIRNCLRLSAESHLLCIMTTNPGTCRYLIS